jgi:excisionase family DNA binding protein
MNTAVAFTTLTMDELRTLVQGAVADALRDKSEDEWLTREAVAAMFGVHPKTVSRLVRRKLLQGTRVGRVLRFRRKEVDRYMARKDGV